MRIDFVGLVTPEVIAINDVKRFCRVDISADDAMITTSFIPSARQYCEAYINNPIVPQTKDIWFDRCKDGYDLRYLLNLPYTKNIRIVDIKNYDSDNEESTYSSASYRLSGHRVILNNGYEWESDVRDYDSMKIQLVSGFGTHTLNEDDEDVYAETVPQAIKQAMSMVVAHWVQQREAQADVDLKNVPMGVTALLAPYRNFAL